MRVKRYIVDSMPEALDKIRLDLGQDAIILNSKPIKTGGIFGLFGKQQIEVVAAVDEKEAEKPKRTPAQPSREPIIRAAATNPTAAKRAYQSMAAGAQANTVAETVAPPDPIVLADAGSVTVRERAPLTAQGGEQSALTRTVNQTDAAQAPRSQEAGGKPAAAAHAGSDQLAVEVRHMRQMFEKLLTSDSRQQLPQPIQTVRDRLLQQEVTEEAASEIIRQLIMEAEPGWEAAEAVKRAEELIIQSLQKAVIEPVGIESNVRYAFFFGPTGVGKTTTIAKLAANCMLKEKRKIGFITADTYRIAAVEQLKTYANILNVPFEVVFSPKEIPQAMERLSGCDLVFVDTAGRNYRNDEYVQGIRELVVADQNSLNFMVLSLASKYSDMRTIIRNFGDVPVSRVIFTKADETEAYGAMLNVAAETNFSISYITTGQNVPDDIIVATPRLIANMIMGE